MDRFTRGLRKLRQAESADVMSLDEAADTMPEAPNDAALFVFAVFANAANGMVDGPEVTCAGLTNWCVYPNGGWCPMLPTCETWANEHAYESAPCNELASHEVTWRFWYNDDPDITPFYDDTKVFVCAAHLDSATEELDPNDDIFVSSVYSSLL